MPDHGPWRHEGFGNALEVWIAREKPSQAIERRVTAWIIDLVNHPRLIERADPIEFLSYDVDDPPAGGITQWTATTPFETSPGYRVVCIFQVDSEKGLLSNAMITELREPLS